MIIVQFQYDLQHPYIVHRHVPCICSGYIKDGSKTTIVHLHLAECFIFNSEMVPECLDLYVLHCFLGWLCTQQQTVHINCSWSLCCVPPQSTIHSQTEDSTTPTSTTLYEIEAVDKNFIYVMG
jgi:hypothetical protein